MPAPGEEPLILTTTDVPEWGRRYLALKLTRILIRLWWWPYA